jgi:hypothetical protein
MDLWWSSLNASDKFTCLMKLYSAQLITQDQLRTLLKFDVKDNSQ